MANVNLNKKESESQCRQIAEYLKKGYSITSLDALKLFGCMRLASRIWDLREQGYNIIACRITTPTGKRVCEYVLSN